jgi:2'-5' RNA ligase
MAYAVELFFDAATEAAIRRLGDTLADSDRGNSGRPHVSLGGCRDLRDASALTQALETLAAEQAGALPVTLAHLGVFPGDEGVIFYGLTVTTPLLLLHRRFHALFAPLVMESSPFYQPGLWVPHCTLANGLPQERLPAALAGLQKQVLPSLSGLLTSLALVEIPSGDERAVFWLEASSVTQ